ncbi:TIGR03862 family flavoprotein [Pseudoxanthomonas japonensis]|uniref:Aminoacetone oxidase family FAD-binding enzyme n=1 Tax=Pseudoxanthomonas japonensis TaxID=69284 RepID=A0ABQ6ZDL9_9GAMM|nr:TIGR03862 family flavoprotein [Pseudoxanthomonas japonensis]KAF1723399.1 aminoacetone oxidase family FAD-binding enzyme [Pseudoxanthomonas japonensis]
MPAQRPEDSASPPTIAVIGGGPAGLMAAETLRAAGLQVDLYDAKGSVGRKFLIAGKGGMNLTHSDPIDVFVTRYHGRCDEVAAWLRDFDADALRAWARGLGVETFVGTSGRVFPSDLKAAPLLRGWVRRLREQGVRFHVQHRWLGWNDGDALRFATPDGDIDVQADATVLAMGGGSWPELGSDGAWVDALKAKDIDVAPLLPSNCGFDIGWSEHLATRFAGEPLKPVVAHWQDTDGTAQQRQGECVLTATGIEGSLVYALSPMLRDAIARDGHATLVLDLLPGREEADLARRLAKPRGSRSLSEHLRREAGVTGVRAALLYEVLDKAALADSACIARTLKHFPFRLQRTRPIAEAISSAGGIRMEALDPQLMLRARPGVFAAGEMLDWEAPTGGYLLTACFASGHHAAHGVIDWLAQRST